jgi:glycerophosphoryl diester phosphodiesterase
VLVVSHDRRLNPDHTRDEEGRFLDAAGPAILSLSLSEVRRYDVGVLNPGTSYAAQFPHQKPVPGTRIPTLDEVVTLVRKSGNDRVRFNIETKLSPLAPDESPEPESFARMLVDALRAQGIAARSTIQSFDWRTLKHVQRLAPEIPTVCLTLERGRNGNLQPGQKGASPWTAGLDLDDFDGSVPRLVAAAGCPVWSPPFRELSETALADAKRLGLAVVVWTVNDPADMARLVDMGVDGIISDYPDRLRAVAAEHGLPLPKATPVEP